MTPSQERFADVATAVVIAVLLTVGALAYFDVLVP